MKTDLFGKLKEMKAWVWDNIEIDVNWKGTECVQDAEGPLADIYKSGSESLGSIWDGKFLTVVLL